MCARMSANDHRYTNDRVNVMSIITSRRYIYTTLFRNSKLSIFYLDSVFKYNKFRVTTDSPKFRVPRSEADICAPITDMDKVICIGMNYKDHCEEQNAPVPKES